MWLNFQTRVVFKGTAKLPFNNPARTIPAQLSMDQPSAVARAFLRFAQDRLCPQRFAWAGRPHATVYRIRGATLAIYSSNT